MRRSLSLLLLILFTLPARAADPPKPGSVSPHHARETWEQHFAQANQAHDGHLTLEEAQGGFALVAKHFEDIDVHHKGYVTQNDVRAWRVMKICVTCFWRAYSATAWAGSLASIIPVCIRIFRAKLR